MDAHSTPPKNLQSSPNNSLERALRIAEVLPLRINSFLRVGLCRMGSDADDATHYAGVLKTVANKLSDCFGVIDANYDHLVVVAPQPFELAGRHYPSALYASVSLAKELLGEVERVVDPRAWYMRVLGEVESTFDYERCADPGLWPKCRVAIQEFMARNQFAYEVAERLNVFAERERITFLRLLAAGALETSPDNVSEDTDSQRRAAVVKTDPPQITLENGTGGDGAGDGKKAAQPTEAEVNQARELCSKNPRASKRVFMAKLRIGNEKALQLMKQMRAEELLKTNPRRR